MADWRPNSANGSKGSKRYGLAAELFDVDKSRGLDHRPGGYAARCRTYHNGGTVLIFAPCVQDKLDRLLPITAFFQSRPRLYRVPNVHAADDFHIQTPMVRKSARCHRRGRYGNVPRI